MYRMLSQWMNPETKVMALPAEYGVTGVKTFIVSHDGVVYEKDFGPATLDAFKRMERFNPDKSWTPVE